MALTRCLPLALASLAAACGSAQETPLTAEGETRVRVEFEGGHETVPVDGGRPVALVAGALQVEDQVFRDAFSGVTPAMGGPPTRNQERNNHRILMDALGPHGVTGDRLNEVSDHYRYRPQAGEMWPHEEAVAFAVIASGEVVRINLSDGGHGYTAPPRVTVPGHPEVRAEAVLGFGPVFEENGRLVEIRLENGRE